MSRDIFRWVKKSKIPRYTKSIAITSKHIRLKEITLFSSHAHPFIYTHTHTHTPFHTHTSHTLARTHTFTRTHSYIHSHTLTHTLAHTYTYTRFLISRVCSLPDLSGTEWLHIHITDVERYLPMGKEKQKYPATQNRLLLHPNTFA